MEFMLGRLEITLQEMGEMIISSRKLGDMIMMGLYTLDKVAYIRFASVYKDFKDPKEFYSLLRSVTKPPSKSGELTHHY